MPRLHARRTHVAHCTLKTKHAMDAYCVITSYKLLRDVVATLTYRKFLQIQVFGDCDMLLPASELITVAQLPEITGFLPEEGRNIANCLRLSSESTVPSLKRKQSMRAQEQKKELMPDAEKEKYDKAEEDRLEAHQFGLKYIVASGQTGCLWIDHFMYLLCEHWYKSNAGIGEARKSAFAQFADGGRMDLGDFASLMKSVCPLGEYEVAHLFMQLVDSEGKVDVDEWLQVLSLYEAGLAGTVASLLPGISCLDFVHVVPNTPRSIHTTSGRLYLLSLTRTFTLPL